MKLVKLLAKELKEWPDVDECSDQICFITQDASGVIFSWNDNGELKFVDGQWYMQGTIPFDEVIFDGSETCSDCSSAIVREEQWQSEREKMNKPKWIRHRGGKCPVKAGTKVVTHYRDGVVSDWCMTRNQDTDEECLSAIWSHFGGETDIMAYYVEETKDQEIEEVETIDTAKAPAIEFAFGDKDSDPKDLDWKQLGTITSNLEIDATEAAKEIDSLVAKWGQIESPLKWRDEILELEAYEEEFRREREKLIRKLESEGFKLIDHIAPVYGGQVIDFSDWRNWQAGDIVECLMAPDKHEGYYFSGINYEIRKVDLDDEGTGCEISVYCKTGMSFWCPSSSFKFIRRP